MVKFLFLPYCPGYDLSTMLNRIGDNGQLSLLPDLRRNVFNTSPLAVMSTVELLLLLFLPYTCLPYWHSELEGSTEFQDWKKQLGEWILL